MISGPDRIDEPGDRPDVSGAGLPGGRAPSLEEKERGDANGGLVQRVGRFSMSFAAEVGAMSTMALRSLLSLVPPRVDWRGLLSSMYRFGVESVPLIIATAFLTGVVVLLLSAVYVQSYGATQLVGWATGYATFRELGPVLIALMFSGRVGSKNTAELAAMKVSEQIDALRAMAIDPYAYLVIPRLLAMVVVLVALTLLGNLCAIVGAALAADLLLGVSQAAFWNSFTENVRLADLFHGLLKAASFGLAIGIVSSRCGLLANGGAPGVGRAVNRSVVSGAVAIFLLDYLITFVLP